MISFTTTAPGRLDVMGGISDYSGGLVLQMPISNQTTVLLTPNQSGSLKITSTNKTGDIDTFSIHLSDLMVDNTFHYETARAAISARPGGAWAAYVVGCFVIIGKEKNVTFGGADIDITSDVPLGKGVSSSAALEVATCKAIAEAYATSIDLEGTELPKLAQKAENIIVGAPCGLMDQLASYHGKSSHLLAITCQPDLLKGQIKVPLGVRFFGIDSGVKHSVKDYGYADVRAAAFMAFTIIALHCGATKADITRASKTGNWAHLPYSGYLSNIPLSDAQRQYKNLLPITINGADFTAEYGHTIDNVAHIHANRDYHIQACGMHPIAETFRVGLFRQLLLQLNTENNPSGRIKILNLLGEIMYQAHEGYENCGIADSATDTIVKLAKQANANDKPIYGAKITGGGSGGTVCLLTDGPLGAAAAEALLEDYKKLSNQTNLMLIC